MLVEYLNNSLITETLSELDTDVNVLKAVQVYSPLSSDSTLVSTMVEVKRPSELVSTGTGSIR